MGKRREMSARKMGEKRQENEKNAKRAQNGLIMAAIWPQGGSQDGRGIKGNLCVTRASMQDGC